MHEIGLYHPRIHFPSDAWVKAAALYWTRMARIVPEGYVARDSETVRALRDNLDFVLDLPPESPLRDLRRHEYSITAFGDFLNSHGDALRRRYGVDQPGHPGARLAADPRNIAEAQADLDVAPFVGVLSMNKLAVNVRESLLYHQLATAEGSWALMHPVLARVYMSVLADDLARCNRLRPITQDAQAFAVGTGWTQERMYDVLLTDAHPHVGGRSDALPDETGTGAIAMLAIQAVIPRDINRIPVKQIVRLRENFKAQFTAFRDAVDAAATEITTELETVEDAVVLRAYIEQEAQERFLVPLEQLRRDLRDMKVDTTTAALTFKYEVPALAGLAAGGVLTHEPLLAGGTALAVGLLGLRRGMRGQLLARRSDSPVSYLMLLQNELAARSTLQAVARRLHQVTGRA